eukprot:872691-Pyramimonas_sp.AAC.1
MAVLVVAAARALRLATYDVIPRALADDTSVQWVGTDLRGARVLWQAVKRFKHEVWDVGLLLQELKSGDVATSRQSRDAAA